MISATLLRRLYRGPQGACPGVCNPYQDEDPRLDRPGGARQRRRNLEAYLERVGRPRLVLLGEALGFRGGRFSGIAFTSERQLAGPDGRRLSWATDPPFRPTSRNPALWLEPSGSVVWDAIGGEPAGVLLWNTFPWHPCRSASPLSNRMPERGMVRENLHVLEKLLEETAGARIVAVGRTAQAGLASLGIEAPAVRHPAHGGAALFREQLRGQLAVLH
jgi:uracil DNA glycosylase superfamily protein